MHIKKECTALKFLHLHAHDAYVCNAFIHMEYGESIEQ